MNKKKVKIGFEVSLIYFAYTYMDLQYFLNDKYDERVTSILWTTLKSSVGWFITSFQFVKTNHGVEDNECEMYTQMIFMMPKDY